MKNVDFKVDQHKHNDRTMHDVVCYIKDKRFVLVPLTSSKKAKAYFYRLLNDALVEGAMAVVESD